MIAALFRSDRSHAAQSDTDRLDHTHLSQDYGVDDKKAERLMLK